MQNKMDKFVFEYIKYLNIPLKFVNVELLINEFYGPFTSLIKYLKDNDVHKYLDPNNNNMFDDADMTHLYGNVKLMYSFDNHRDNEIILSIDNNFIIKMEYKKDYKFIIPNNNAHLDKTFADFANIYKHLRTGSYEWLDLFKYILEHSECFDLVT
jgi:hypothetical protein